MRCPLLLFLVCLTAHSWSQSGYIKLRNDSVFEGIVKDYSGVREGSETLLTNYVTLRSPSKAFKPRKFNMSDVYEFATGKDTFRVFVSFAPFQNQEPYFDVVKAKILQQGALNLMAIREPSAMQIVSVWGNASPLMILENPRTRYIRAVPNTEQFFEVLRDFFPDEFLINYSQLYGRKVRYDKVPEMVRLFNSKKLIDDISAAKIKPKSVILDQLMKIVENTHSFMGISEDQLRSGWKPDIILGPWTLLEIENYPDSTTAFYSKMAFFDTACGVLFLMLSGENHNVSALIFFPKGDITEREVKKSLKEQFGVYEGELIIESKRPIFFAIQKFDQGKVGVFSYVRDK